MDNNRMKRLREKAYAFMDELRELRIACVIVALDADERSDEQPQAAMFSNSVPEEVPRMLREAAAKSADALKRKVCRQCLN